MATPPPEAPPVVKEEKPQLPPSPAGASAPDMPSQTPVGDVKTGATIAPETNGRTMNGHTPEAGSIANGTTATSPPKSPVSAPVPAPTGDTIAASVPDKTETPAATEPITESTTAPEVKALEETPTPYQTQVPESVSPAVDGTPANSFAATPQAPAPFHAAGAAAPSLDNVADLPAEKMAVDGAQDVPGPAPAPAPVQSELPHHTTTETATPTLPPLQTQDHEMKNAPSAPLSPSKVSREREMDPAEEPAAKRTKVEDENGVGVEYKVPELPTPVAETPIAETAVVARAGSETGITKMQLKFLTKSLSSLKRMHDSRFFREPVDPVKLNIPSYVNVITQPMDLGTMEKKLKAGEYSSPQAVADDISLMVRNAMTFNGPDHLVTQEGQKLEATFKKQMLNLPRPDEVEEKKPKKVAEKTSAARREPRTSAGSQMAKAASPQNTTFALGPEGLPVIRRDSTNPDGRPKRSIHPPKRDLPYSTKPKKKKFHWELKFCQDVLDELHKQKHSYMAYVFYQPVDPVALNIPTYHSVIKKPMDLSTMQSKLQRGQYENAEEFEADMRLMFKNCYRFNLEGDPTYLAGKSLEAVFDDKWKEKGAYLAKHEPQHDQHSDSSDVDSDDEEEEESDEDTEKLTLLQKQMAEISRQMEMISSKKKKTPPSSKKAGSKSKSGKKDSKKSSGKKEKKSKSSYKAEKGRWVSYHDKQVISNGISSLPDKKMQEALKIIQNNVPALKVSPHMAC